MIKIAVFNKAYDRDMLYVPYLRLILEAYYKDYGKFPEKINWLLPFDCESDHVIDNRIIEDQPDIIAISTYVWNIDESLRYLKRFRELAPNALILLGGPGEALLKHDTMFQQYPELDCVASSLVNGEWFFTTLLDNLLEKEAPDYRTVIGAIYPAGSSRMTMKSTEHRDPREFAFTQTSAYAAPWLKGYIERLVTDPTRNATFDVFLETTRGCPYSCSFCEWGLGARKKVVTKPMETIEKELIDMATLGIREMVVTDANFGMLKRDIQVTELMGKYLFAPRPFEIALRFSGLSKTNKKNIYDIYKILHASNARIKHYKLSIQDADDDVKLINARTDIPLEDNFDLGRRIKEDFGYLTILEIILGLPGKTLESNYKDYDIFFHENDSDARMANVFILLEGTPAAMPEFREKYKINSDFLISKDNYSSALLTKEEMEEQDYFNGAVIETSTYTRYEWLNMYLINHLYISFVGKGQLRKFFKAAGDKHGLKISAFLKAFVENLNTLVNPFTFSLNRNLKVLTDDLKHQRLNQTVRVFGTSHYAFLYVAINHYCITQKSAFIAYVKHVLKTIGFVDDAMVDFYCLSVADIAYDPRVGRTLEYEGKTYHYQGDSTASGQIHWHLDPASTIYQSSDFLKDNFLME